MPPVLRQERRQLAQNGVARRMAVGIVNRLEVGDVDQQHRQAQRRTLQGLEVRCHVSAVVEAGERIGNCEFDVFLEPVAQVIAVAFAFGLRAHARGKFTLVDRTRQVVVNAHVEGAQQPSFLARFHRRDDDGQVPRALERAHLSARA